MTGFGSFDNSTCKRVLDLLEPGDLRLGQVVIKRVAVVKLGVNNVSGDGVVMRLCRYEGWVVVRTLYVSERSLSSICAQLSLTSAETGGWE